MNLLLSRCLPHIFFPFKGVSIVCFLKAGHDQKNKSGYNILTNSNPLFWGSSKRKRSERHCCLLSPCHVPGANDVSKH